MRSAHHRLLGISLSSLSTDELFGLSVLVLTYFAIFLIWLFPATGVRYMEVGMPILALWIGYRGRNEPFDPAVGFPILYLLWNWLGSIPIVASSNQHTSLLVDFGPTQWMMYAVGFAGFWTGLHCIRDIVPDKTLMRRALVDWDEDIFFLVLVLASLLVFGAWALIVSKEGITILQADITEDRLNLGADNHIAFEIFMLGKLIFPLIFLYSWTARKPKLRLQLYALGTAIIMALVSTGNRSIALPPLLTVLALRQYLRKSTNLLHLTLITLLATLAISVTGYYRSLQHDGPSHVLDLAEMGFPVEIQPFTDFYLYVRAPLDTLRNTVRQIPAVTPYQYGQLSTSFLTQLLPGRHPSSDFFFKDLLGHDFVGLGEPATILGPFYVDFGFAGIFFGMLFSGLLSKALYMKMLRGSVLAALLYCYFWQMLVTSLYGALITYIIDAVVPIGWIMIYWLVANKVGFRRTGSTRQLETSRPRTRTYWR